MVDWPGLLKWSLQFQKEQPVQTQSNFKPMDQETKKWLEEALEQYFTNESKMLAQINQSLLNFSSLSKGDQLGTLENLQDILDSLDRNIDFCKMGGLDPLLNLIFSNNQLLHQIFASITQNQAEIQSLCIELGCLKLMNLILNSKNIGEQEAAFLSLSSLIRGEYLQGKREFIVADGINYLYHLIITDNSSKKLRMKSLLLLKDLLFYDDRLHLTFNNTSIFENMSGNNNKPKKEKIKLETQFFQKNNPLFQSAEEQKQFTNELPQNQQFKGIVKKQLIFLDTFETNGHDGRIEYINLIMSLLESNQNFFNEKEKEEIKSFIKVYENGLEQFKDKLMDLYQSEKNVIQLLFKYL